MSVYCALGVLAGPLSFILIRSTAASISELPRTALLLLPFVPPAMMCLVPYYIGVLGLRSIAKVINDVHLPLNPTGRAQVL